MKQLLCTTLALATLSCATAPLPDRPLKDSDLIGAWQLVRTEITLPDGSKYPVPNYGSDPHGYLTYDASHVMCVFLAVGESRNLPPAQYRNLMPPIPASYCARWELAAGGHTVLHHVLVGNDPSLLQAPQRRKATLRGRVLELRRDPPPADLRDYVLIFEKVSDVRRG